MLPRSAEHVTIIFMICKEFANSLSLIRSSSLTHGNRLSVSSTRPKKHIGRHGFAVAAPTEWNKLPQTVRSQQTIDGFRSQLKTHLFRLAYPTLVIPWRALFRCRPISVPGLSLLGLKHIRGFVSILHSINPTIITIVIYYLFIF